MESSQRVDELLSEKSIRLGVFGARGSFSEEAGLAYAQREGLRVQVENLPGTEALMRAVLDRSVDFGVLPVVNTVGGLVRATFETLGRHLFEPIGQVTLDIHHCLLVRSDLAPGQRVVRIASHPQAIMQCSRYTAERFPGCSFIEAEDTASAARDLAQGILPDSCGVIASRRAAELFGLVVLDGEIQDAADNRTTFLVLGRAAHE